MADKWIPEVEMVEADKWAAMCYNAEGTARVWVTDESRKPRYFASKEEAMEGAQALAAGAPPGCQPRDKRLERGGAADHGKGASHNRRSARRARRMLARRRRARPGV